MTQIERIFVYSQKPEIKPMQYLIAKPKPINELFNIPLIILAMLGALVD